MKKITADICVIGAGSGGLSVAAGAAQMGVKVVLIEADKMGGDCLNYGCVPSKALLAAAKQAHIQRKLSVFGIRDHEPEINFEAVHNYVHSVIKSIQPHDSQDRFESLGVTVIREKGRFTNPHEVQAGKTRIRAKYFVIATGSKAFIPPISGLDQVQYLTNETIFNLTSCPDHLLVVGGGPIGVEMAQAHRRLGAKVTLVDKQIMPNDDPDMVAYVKSALEKDGVHIHEGEFVTSVEATSKSSAAHKNSPKNNNENITLKTESKTVTGSHVLIATGRAPTVMDIGLEEAGIDFTPKGITVNQRLQTSQEHIFAIGDCIGDLQFTHVAGYHAGIIIRNLLFKLPAKTDLSSCPRVTYCDPELAHVGLTEAEAKKYHSDVKVTTFPFLENDRALAENHTEGMIKVISTSKGKIMGASIVGQGAGDLILPWVMAVQTKMSLSKMASFIAPYPTRSEISKRVAGSFFTPKLYSDNTKKIVNFLMRWWP